LVGLYGNDPYSTG